MLRAETVCHAVSALAKERVTLDYASRFLRRKVVESDGGLRFLVDLPEAVLLHEGDAFQLRDGRLVSVVAAVEPLLEVSGDIARFAWHIGNRHTPCQIEGECLRIARDPVLGDMLLGLGADLREVMAPFSPEGGAYGHGRTHAHG